MKVRELMTPRVLTIEVTASCHDAVVRMHRANVRHLPVVNPDGRVVGIVTDRDVRQRLLVPGVFRDQRRQSVRRLLSGVAVEQIMSTPVASVGPDDDVQLAAHRMHDHKLGSLLVIDDRRVVGILTETDLLQRLLEVDGCCPAVVDIATA